MSRPVFFPTQGHLLLCRGDRCRARGSGALFSALWAALEQENLAYYRRGGAVRLTECGCLGACGFGPTLCVYRCAAEQAEEAWYAPVTLPLALAIARAVQAEAPLPSAHRYGPAGAAEQ